MEKKTYEPADKENDLQEEARAEHEPQRSLKGLAAELKNILIKDRSRRRKASNHIDSKTSSTTLED